MAAAGQLRAAHLRPSAKANATYISGLVFPLHDDDPDYPALTIANVIYGGSTRGRAATRVRQHDGLSYSISSHFFVLSFDPRATIMTTASCNPHNISKVEKAITEEFAWLLRDGVTADELTQAKHGYLQAQKGARASDAALARMLAGLSHVGRTINCTAVATRFCQLARHLGWLRRIGKLLPRVDGGCYTR